MAFDSNLSGITEVDAHLVTAYEQMFIIEQEQLAKGLDSVVTVQFNAQAKTFTFPKYGALTVQTSALTEDNDMTSESMSDTAITVTPIEVGNVSTMTTLADLQSGGLPSMAAVRLHAKNMRESQEKKLILIGEAGSNEITVNSTNEASTTAGEVLTAAYVKRARKLVRYQRNTSTRTELSEPYNNMKRPFIASDLTTLPEGWQCNEPDFVGVGVPKAGTSWWYSLMLQHPQVVPHRLLSDTNPVSKELNYFSGID